MLMKRCYIKVCGTINSHWVSFVILNIYGMNLQRIGWLFVGFAFFMACSNEPKTTEPTTAATSASDNAGQSPIVGNDADAHGCKASTGMTWSAVRNQCVALFEAGIRLAPIDSFTDKTTAAFVVLKGEFDDSQVELFIPKHDAILIDKVADNKENTWKSEDYTLTKLKNVYTLRDKRDNRVLYEGSAGK